MSGDTVILFIPGLYGSRIVHRSGEPLWLVASNGLRTSHSLALPLDGSESDTRAEGILEKVPVGPLYSVDVYGGLLTAIRREMGSSVRVETFDYDWRRSVEEIIPRLSQRIDAEKRKGARKVVLLAHSMGGLLATYYLRYGAQVGKSVTENWEGAGKISSAVFAGVPFGGAMAVFRNALHGIRVILNWRLLDRTTYSSLQSTYTLLPYGQHDHLVDEKLNPVTGLVRDFGQWKENRWGLLHPDTRTPEEKLREKYTQTSLQLTNRFFDRIHAPVKIPPTALPKIFRIVGIGRQTLRSGLKKGTNVYFWPADIRKASPKFPIEAIHAEGDGAVTVSATEPPSYLPIARYLESREDHLLLLTSKKTRKDLFDFLSARS